MALKGVRLLATAVILAIVLLYSNQTYAQSSGGTSASVTGVVRDNQQAVIGGATITAKDIRTNQVRKVVTAEDGTFLINQLPAGEYEIKATSDGFTGKIFQSTLIIGTTSVCNFDLQPSAVSDVVVVEASGGISVEGRTEKATNIAVDEINNLPINRRDFLDFTLTTAGVTPDRVSATGAAASSGLSFNGQSARNNNVSIDGLDNNEPGNGSVRSTFSQDAVQEFQVIGANSSAEFGRSIGGVVNIVTKGGSNEIHGSLYNYVRNDSTSARDAFSASKPEFRQFQFGATLGGPIKKDKAFYFTSFERLTIKQNNIVTISDQVVKSVRKLGLQASNGPVPFAENSSRFLARADFQVNPNDRLTVRYNYAGVYNGALQTFGGGRDSSAAGVLDLNDNNIGISNTWINPTSSIIYETRFLFTRRDVDLNPVDANGPSLNIFTAGGLANIGRDPLLPQTSLSRSYEIVNNITFSRGKHQIKTGFDFIFLRIPDKKVSIPVLFGGLAIFTPLDFSQALGIPGLPAFSAEQFLDPSLRTPAQLAFLTVAANALPAQFPGFPAGLPLANLPIPVSFLQGFGNPVTSVGYDYYSAFVQDDFRVKPNLLIKAGIRYDQERIRFAPKNSGNFSPRLAFFYRPGQNEHLSLFGSYGIYHVSTQFSPATVTQFLDGKTVATPVLPFPFSILPFNAPGRRFPSGASVPQGVPLIPQLARDTLLSKDLRNGYAQQVNFGVNYVFNDKYGISASYQMVRGLKIFLARNINPVVRPVPNDPIMSAITGRANPTRGELISFETSGDSYYHAGTVAFFARLPKRFSVLTHFTVSKTIDDYIDALRVDILELQNPLDFKSERALSLQDVRGRFVFSGNYDTGSLKNPFLKDFLFSSIITLSAGQPFNLLVGADLDGNGDTAAPADRPNGIGRNAGRGAGFASVDMRVARTITVGEKVKLIGYFEAFNVFNRLNVNEVNRIFPLTPNGFNLTPQEDGRFTATPDRFASAFRPRQIQFGFRVTF
ncbi:MAG: TonB-dependent receptor [Acidobacteria bacterium]|nr:TonB-dependent receptor [Acidobacteriota bacterium]